jgi:hypothetical protein
VEVKPNLVGLPGYRCTTVPGLVRAIVDVYAACAILESVAAPLIQFGRRYVEQINAPSNRILIVPRKGQLGALREMGSGKIASIAPVIDVYFWGGEPTQTSDELEDELVRFDLADPMVARFINVLNRVAPAKYELLDLDPDQGQSSPAAVNEYGETYLLTFRFLQDIARDGVVFSALPTLNATTGLSTPQLSPPPNYAVSGAVIASIDLTTEPAE